MHCRFLGGNAYRSADETVCAEGIIAGGSQRLVRMERNCLKLYAAPESLNRFRLASGCTYIHYYTLYSQARDKKLASVRSRRFSDLE